MSESPTLVAQNTPPPRSNAASFVPDEWGGSDLANPEWSRLDYQAARANVQLIRQVVQSRGGDPDETAALVGDALRQVSERAPFGHVGNAFLYGATGVLLERANAMSPADFNQYLRTLDHRQNPINLFERTPLDALTEASKQATVRHLQQTGGLQSFRLFGAMEGQNGPLAFSAGAADAVAENYGRGARDLLTIAANPLEAGRQFTNLAGSIGQLPQAVQEAYRQLQTEIGRWGESDYRKGYITGQAVITAIDVRDTVEAAGRLGALATELRAGRIHGIADAMEVLEHGRPRNRGAETPDAPGAPRQVEPSPGARSRVPDPTPVVDPVATPAGRQRLPDATQARLITNAFGFEGALGRELDGEILRWAQGRPGNAIENLRNSPELLYGRGNGDIGLIGNAYLRAADIPEANLPAARRALGEIRDAMGGRSGADYARLYDDLMVPGSQSRRYFDGLVEHARGELRVEGIRDRSVANAVVIDAAGQPQQVFATARRPETVELQTGNERFVAEIRTATTGGGQQYVGWGTNERWYPFQDSDRVFNADGSINRERAAQAIMNDLNTGSAQRDALLPYDAWQQRRIEEQRLGSVGNAVIIDANGDPRRIVATAGSGEAVEIVGADRQRRMIEIRDGQTADGQRYLGFGTNEQWYPFPGDRPVQRADGSLDIAVARDYITAQARAGNINRNAMVPGEQWDATHGRIGNDGLDQALQPLPQGAPRDRVQEAPTPDRTPPVDTPRTETPRTETPRTETPPAETPPRTPPNDASQTPPQQRTPPPDATDRTPGETDAGGQRQLPPSSQPNDPLLPFHAIEREQRMRAPEPLVAPGGQRFDVMGVDEDGRLRLRPEGQRVGALPAEAMFEMHPSTPQTLAQPGNAVTYGREPWITAGRNEQGIVLRDPGNAERTVVVPDARAAEIATPVGREVTYQGETWRFQALQSPGWQPGVERRGFQLVDPGHPERTVFVPENRAVDIRMRLGEDGDYRFGDVRHGVIRLNPMDGGREITMPLTPGMTFEARLRDRELEGPYRITVGNDGELSATGRIRNGTEVTQRIEPSDIAPRYVDVRSPDFNDRFEVDSFIAREANLRNRAIATEPTGLPLRDPAFGNLDGTPGPQLALGTQSLETQADFIRRNAGNLAPGQTPSLTVFNIAFSNEGEARQVLDAMSDFRRMHGDAAQIRIVAYEPSFHSFEGTPAFRELQEVIRRDRIQVEFFGNDPSQREVIHAKGVAVNDQVLFSTGAVIDASRNKADISVQLPPDAARAFNAYLNEAVIGNAGVDRRQQLAADAAREGVLINDPEARLPYIARAQDGLIRGAQRELTVSVSELRNPETTRAIIERADAGVNVQVQFREMDPESRRLLAEAQQRLPNLAVEDVSAWQPRPHYNVIVADRQQAYVGTAYLWQNQQDMLQHGRSFENGVLLQGDAVQRLQAQMEALRSLQPAHPGQRLLNPAAPDAPDVGVRVNGQTTGSISVSAPPGSSIGVDVRDSTVDGAIQTVSGSGNVQVSGNRETLGTAATAAPDGNGNVQVTATPGLRVELQNPGTSGRTGTDVRIDNSTVNGGVQSIVGDGNVQVNVNEARVQGGSRQTATGDGNRQTQALGANVATGRIEQTIDGRSGARQQIGDDPAPRARDEAAPVRPQPLQSGGRRYDIVGVNDGEQPSLEVVTHNAVPRYVPTDALVPRPPGEPHPDARARQVTLVTAGAQGEVREAFEIAGVRRDGLLLARSGETGAEPRFVPYADPAARVEFAFPNGSTYVARQTVDGSVRFDPVQAERTRIPLEPGMQFEARLQGRETEGAYRIEVGADFTLSARSTDPARAREPAERIAVSDLAPTWQRVTSTTAPGTELFVDSAQYRRAAQRVGREGEPDYPIGTLSGDSVIRHGFANQLYRPVLDTLRDPATTGDVSIAMYGIGTSREGRQYTDALLDYAQRHPDARVTLHSGDVQIDGRRGDALREWLSEHHPNVRISEPLPPSNFNVPHEKIVAIGDQVFIGSEKIGTSMSRKVGFMAEMGPEESRLVHRYIQGLGDPRTDPAQTRQTLSALAERGVLIDDPRVGFHPNTAAMNRVLDEAQGHLRIYQSDLTDTVATQRIIDRARDGVQVDLRYRDIDPQSQRMLEQAAADVPTLRFQRVPNDALHPIYQHENYVISERGGVLSSAYMWEPKAGQVPRYTNGGEGGVLLDARQAQQYERYLDTAPTRQIGPGAILDLGEEAWRKLSPRLLEQLDRLRPQTREAEPPATPATPPREPTPPANDDRRSALPDAAAPQQVATAQAAATSPASPPSTQAARDPALDDPRHPQHPMFASALERIQTYERDRGIDSGEFGRNVAGSLTASAVASGLPEIRHVVFNAEGTRAFAVDTPNLDAEWRRIAFVDVAGAGQQSLAASTDRLREAQVQAASQAVASPQPQVRPEEPRSGARMA